MVVLGASHPRMREDTVAFHAWVTIAIILFAVPALSVVPLASAAELPSHTLWRPYGPYVKQVLITVFTNEVSELAAFQAGQLDWFDWPIPRPNVQGLIANPDALVSQPLGELGYFWITINHHAPLFGIPQQKPRTDFTTINDGRFDGLQSTVEPTPEGVHVRQAIAHLIDKASFVSEQQDCSRGSCIAIDDPHPAGGCLERTKPLTDPAAEVCSSLEQRSQWDTLHTTLCSAGVRTPCAYRVTDGPGGGRPSNADLQAAREHLLAAGLRDSDGDGLLDFSATGQIIFAIRNDDPRRLSLGNVVSDALDSLFEKGPNNEPVVHRVLGGISALGPIVFFTEPADDWHIYINGGSGGPIADDLYVRNDSGFATDFCGGKKDRFTLNFAFYCSPAFDERIETGFIFLGSQSGQPTTVHGVIKANSEAIDIAGRTVMTIPVYSRSFRTLAHNGWDGVVDTWGNSIADTFNWFNMRQKPGYVPQGGLGLPGGGTADLLRAGFRQGTSSLNIFHAGTVWESYVIFNILDSPGGFNPRAAPSLLEPYEKSITRITESFNDNGADQIPGTADDEPVTVIELTLRNDLQFHNGAQVTAVDFLESGLAYRDVPMGGFGFAAIWEPVIAHSIPIPGSNCGNLCVQLVLRGKSPFHKLDLLGSPILPLHLWDTNRDGKICSRLGLGECSGRAADLTVDVNFDPMAAGILIGHGPWMCLDPETGRPGGSCSKNSLGFKGGQLIGPGGTFHLTRNDNYILCCPTVSDTPLHRFSQADVNKDWRVDITNDFVLAAGNQTLQALIVSSLDQKLGGTQGKVLTGVDLTNTGNIYPVA